MPSPRLQERHPPDPEFDPREHWETRLEARYDLSGVGYDGLSRAFNEWMYKVRGDVFSATVRAHLPTPGDVLDVGSGTCFYIRQWLGLNARSVAGSDLTTVAVEQLRARHPECRFERYEMGQGEVPFAPSSFDAISAMDVLFHIVDDEQYRRAFQELHGLTRPGGLLIWSDNFMRHGSERLTHQASRPLDEIEGYLSEAGWEFVERKPMFVLMNAPSDRDSRLWWLGWKAFYHLAGRRERLGNAIGRAVYPLERRLLERVKEGPSTEIAVYRKA